jgi:hypothetical protein
MPKAGEPAVPNPMKILTIHNRYKIRGGEDESRESEDAILMARGHQFDQIVFDNTLLQDHVP